MLHGKRTRKAVAATLLVVMLTEILTPTVTYALTSGPTAPEATSFEPIDTTDMVNLQTGDFTYNIPLLEVPGPEGGYPLSLSYHAGIQPNEDASWVGLGFTLNPGAINRSVNGYPDDWYNLSTSNHTYWSGGTTRTYGVGVNIGISHCATVGAGLSFSQDTYQGFGIGGYMSLSVGDEKSGFGGGLRLGVSPYGDAYLSGGIGLSSGGIGGSQVKGSVGVGFQTNFKSVSGGFSGGLTYSSDKSAKVSLVGASIATGGGKPSLELGGLSTYSRGTKDPGIQTRSSGFSVEIPITVLLSVSLSASKVRYFTDEKTDVATHGGLYATGWEPNNQIQDDVAYDTYSLLEDPTDVNVITYSDPKQMQGGAFADFDVYSVNAQGLGGGIKPYLFQSEILGQNLKNSDGDRTITYFSPGNVSSRPEFRFVGDFSNSYRQNYSTYTNNSVDYRATPPPFDTPVYGNSDGTYGYTSTGTGYKLAGSKNVNVGVTIKPSDATGYIKSDRYKTNMIEGFSITNESGVTYHYALPAYSYDEENYQERISRDKGLSFNRQTKGNPYAYTWYLTTITGPDFVDRDGDSKAGVNDWGYWMNFEYGKWSNNYVWRNPSEGYNRDEDNEWQNCSMGRKEVYYLNAIRSRTHVAFFEKEIRKDGKGSDPSIFSGHMITSNKGFPPFTQVTTKTDYLGDGAFGNGSNQSLRLSKVYLLRAQDAGIINFGVANAYSSYETPYNCVWCQNTHFVFDKTDVEAIGRANIESKAIRIVDFIYDYSLSAGTNNSFDVFDPGTKYGKLTLKKLNFRGKGGASLLPPTLFEYELSGSDLKSQNNVTLTSSSFSTTNGSFSVGDLIQTTDGLYCGVITKSVLSGSTYTYTLANSLYVGGSTTANIQTTKNPPYNKDAYDSWGLFKSDIKVALIDTNENLARQCSQVSAKSLDAWCLRKITSPLGGSTSVKFESDSYSKSLLNSNNSFILKSFILQPNRQNIQFTVEDYGFPLSEIDLVVGNSYRVQFLSSYDGVYPLKNKYTNVNRFQITAISGSVLTGVLQSPIPASFGSFNFASILTGNLSIQIDKPVYGGGIRVSDLMVSEGTTLDYLYTHYNYDDPNLLQTSGVTSYSPSTLDFIDHEAAAAIPATSKDAERIIEYRAKLFENTEQIYPIARELPPPSVLYEYVTVSNHIKNADEQSVRNIEGKTQYQFEVFRPNMVVRELINSVSSTYTETVFPFSIIPQVVKNYSLKKFTASIGNLKRTIQFDANNRKVTETTNKYLHDGLENLDGVQFMDQYKSRLSQYFHQGYIQERGSEVKRVQRADSTALNGIKSTYMTREEFPCIQTGQTVINYISGVEITTQNLEFDFYSGAVTKTVETDSYGNRIMTETVPAYRKYPSMGLKGSDVNNKNMLTQVTGTYSYKANTSNNATGLISAQVETWSNLVPAIDKDYTSFTQNNVSTTGDVWRKQSTYNWMAVNKTLDGMTAIDGFNDFLWSNPGSSNANWKKTSEITLYDVYSKGLEEKGINNNMSALKMDYSSKRIAVVGSNAKFNEIAFSGAEDEALNQTFNVAVKKGDGVVSTADAHTGSQSLKLGVAGKKGLLYSAVTSALTYNRAYVASVWVKPVTGTTSDVKLFYDIDGVVKGTSGSSASTKSANGWTLVTLPISGSDIIAGKTLTVGCRNDHATVEAYVDDIRFQPLTASTTAYVYDPFSGELTYVLDNNNLYTKYEYDASGKLIKIFKEQLGTGVFKTNEYLYNYGQSLITFTAPVYTRIMYTYTNNSPSTCNQNYNYQAYIKFYSDYACTTPVNVTNFACRYTKNTSSGSITYNIVTGGTPTNQYSLGTFNCLSYDCSESVSYPTIFEIVPQDQYIIRPTVQPVPPTPTIWAKLERTFTNTYYNGCYKEDYYDVDVKFYSNAAMTNSTSINNIHIKYYYLNQPYTIIIGSSAVSSVRLYTGAMLKRTDNCEVPPFVGYPPFSLAGSIRYTYVHVPL